MQTRLKIGHVLLVSFNCSITLCVKFFEIISSINDDHSNNLNTASHHIRKIILGPMFQYIMIVSVLGAVVQKTSTVNRIPYKLSFFVFLGMCNVEHYIARCAMFDE